MPALPIIAAALLAAGPSAAPAPADCRPAPGVEAAITRIVITATAVEVSYQVRNGSPAPAWVGCGTSGCGVAGARVFVERAGEVLVVGSLLVPAAAGAPPDPAAFRRVPAGGTADEAMRLAVPVATRARGAAADRSRIDLDLVRHLRLELGVLACPTLSGDAAALAPTTPCGAAGRDGPARPALACQVVVVAERGFPWGRSTGGTAARAKDPYAVPMPFLPANLQVFDVERGTCAGCAPGPDPHPCPLALTPEQVRVLLVRSIEMPPGALAQGRRRGSCVLRGTVTWRDAGGLQRAAFEVSSVLSTTLRFRDGTTREVGCDAWCATDVERAAPRAKPAYSR